jgi:hypothetical protein
MAGGAPHFSDNSFWLIGVQLLGGVVADIRGTGRYNLALGAVGIGASLSGLATSEVVDHFGYGAAFLSLGAAAPRRLDGLCSLHVRNGRTRAGEPAAVSLFALPGGPVGQRDWPLESNLASRGKAASGLRRGDIHRLCRY